MLQRVYGTAFFDKKDLDAYLAQVEEAKKRDHRLLGKELELFTISPLVGSGLILWMPKGAIVRGVLETFIKDELIKRGYQPVYTPAHRQDRAVPDQRPLSLLQGLAVPAAHGLLDDAADGAGRRPGERRRSTTPPRSVLLGRGGHPRAMPDASSSRRTRRRRPVRVYFEHSSTGRADRATSSSTA